MLGSTPFASRLSMFERPDTSRARAETSERSQPIDALRGLAAIAIFVSHAGAGLSPAYAWFESHWFDLGKAGVMVFFLCSGFIIPASLERRGSVREFWISRVLRLYPLYWFVIALSLVFQLVGSGIPGADQSVVDKFMLRPVGTIVANLTMLQPLFGYEHIVIVSWSFAVQLLYYALLSALFLLGLHRRTVPIAVGLSFAAMLGESVFAHALGVELPRGSISYLASIFVGTAVYRARRREISGATLGRLLSLAVAMLAIIAIGSTTTRDGVWMPLSMLTSHLVAYGLFCGAALVRLPEIPAPLVDPGRIAYSVLLMHPIVITLLPPTSNLWSTLLLWFAALYLLSSATYRWIEQPAAAFGMRLLANWSRPRAPTTAQQSAMGVQREAAAPVEVLQARGLG